MGSLAAILIEFGVPEPDGITISREEITPLCVPPVLLLITNVYVYVPT
jgi:hypothetical protein